MSPTTHSNSPREAVRAPSARSAPLGYDAVVSYLLVAAGGALGATARFLLTDLVHRVTTPFFPWGTFIVNVSGCFVFGLVAGLGDARGVVTPNVRAFVLVGILGGYTTFSSFTFETMSLARGGQIPQALGNILGQVTLGLLAFWAAWALVQATLGGRS